MKNKVYLSIDLESWCYPDLPEFLHLSSQERKAIDNGYIERSIYAILDLLATTGHKVTFFAIAEIYEWYPKAFEAIVQAGHELGYHTHRHTIIRDRSILHKDLVASAPFLERFRPVGFRAPELYLPEECRTLLIEHGFQYSSSVYGAVGDQFHPQDLRLKEIPVSSWLYRPQAPRNLNYPRLMRLPMLFQELPYGSGYFFALLPMAILNKLIISSLEKGVPPVLFVHSWQIVSPEDATFPNLWYKVTHPQYLPYTLNIKEKLKHLASCFSLECMGELR